MLYDPKWEQKTETKADPLKLESLISWLEQKPAHAHYNYQCHGGCLLAQYFTAAYGRPVRDAGIEAYFTGADERIYYPDSFGLVASVGKYTFGAALERARALID